MQSTETDVDIYYTINSATIPTSFTGEKYTPENPIYFMNDFGINTFELMCVAVCKGKLDSVVVSKYYKEIRRDEDRPAHLMQEDGNIRMGMMVRPVHIIERDELDSS